MKRLKLFSILACCSAALTFMSCNTGSDSSSWTPLNPTQKASCFSQVAGSYSGKMVYYSEDHKAILSDVTDTLSVSWTIGTGLGSDTTMTVTNLPAKILSKYIPEEKVSKALAAYEAPVSLKSAMYFYQTTPAPTFLLIPEVVKCPITYDGATHTISLYFYQSNLSAVTSYGYYNATDKQLAMSIIFGGYKVDADNSSTSTSTLNYTINGRTFSYAPLMFIATK